ncbi:hypothetical protein SEA_PAULODIABOLI_71 [Microbacterium phage PauloDiaboli]|nr:hypothetical protein SEA_PAULODIABOLI_71 [Microbacterium phage PauloDiaboli]QWY83922.1 hypothetical protein SEA_A3WALLY_72 [Microbacterium phage A3Wally]
MTTEQPLSDAADAIEEVVYRFRAYTQPSSDLVNSAHHLVELANAVSDLASYHAGYDIETGTLPYEREDD